jgi:putative photosynthetic complex assembly protein
MAHAQTRSRTTPWAAAPLVGAGVLIVASIALAVVSRHTDIGATRLSEPVAASFVDLAFEDHADGTVLVRNAKVKEAARLIKPGEDGFIRVAIGGLARERRIANADASAPFRLGQTADGTLFLRDLATDRVLLLAAYGHGNAQSFAKLMSLGRIPQ